MANKDTFILHMRYEELLNTLSDTDYAAVMKAVFKYVRTGEEPQFKPEMRMLFLFIKQDLDRNSENYEKTCHKRAEAGIKSAESKKANLTNSTKATKATNVECVEQVQQKQQVLTNSTNPTNSTDNENENENENDIRDKETCSPDGERAQGITNIADIKKAKEAENERRFNEFWQQYPKKVAKKDARKAWDRLKPNAELFVQITEALNRQIQTEGWQKEGGRYIPNPATWLNGRRWTDEVLADYPKYAPTARGQPVNVFEVLNEIIAEEEAKEFEQERNRAADNADFLGLPPE